MTTILRTIGVLAVLVLVPSELRAQGAASCGESGSGFSLGLPGSGTLEEMVDAALLPAFEGKKIECRPCKAGETREIELRIVSSDMADDWRAKKPVEHWFETNSSGELGAWLFKVSDELQIPAILDLFARECIRVKQLTVSAHGTPGSLYFGERLWNEFNTHRVLPPGAECVMSRDAGIDFLGCNAGRGCRGAGFFAGIGRRLLSKGGEIRGATHYVAANILTGHAFSLNLQWQKYSRWPSGTETLSHPSCQEEIEETVDRELARLRDLEGWVRACMLPMEGKRLLKEARELAGELSAIRDLAGYENGSGVLTPKARELPEVVRYFRTALNGVRGVMRAQRCFVE